MPPRSVLDRALVANPRRPLPLLGPSQTTDREWFDHPGPVHDKDQLNVAEVNGRLNSAKTLGKMPPDDACFLRFTAEIPGSASEPPRSPRDNIRSEDRPPLHGKAPDVHDSVLLSQQGKMRPAADR